MTIGGGRMSEPTTGPYAVNDYREIVSPGGESVIASVLDADIYAGTMAESPEADANARLLAASWEMLQVCRELDGLKWCASWEGDGRNETIITRALGMARAVLAKVEPKG